MMKTKLHSVIFSFVRIFPGGMSFIYYAVLGLLVISMIIACEKIEMYSRPYVATVNGSKIYLDEYQSVVDQKINMISKEILDQPEYRKKFEEEVLDGMIIEKIMFMRAQELNITVSDAELDSRIKEIKKDYGQDFTSLFQQENVNYEKWKEDFKKEMLLQKLVAVDVNDKIKISDDEAENYFNQHRDHYKRDARVRIVQIVVRDMATAKKAMEKLNSGEKFAKVAERMSISPEAHHGGDLGFITKWVMPEPLDKTIFKMPVNRISPIVQSSYGFHIFKILESRPAGNADFADVREDVIADMRLQKEDAAYTVWLEGLKGKAVIEKQTDIKLKRDK